MRSHARYNDKIYKWFRYYLIVSPYYSLPFLICRIKHNAMFVYTTCVRVTPLGCGSSFVLYLFSLFLFLFFSLFVDRKPLLLTFSRYTWLVVESSRNRSKIKYGITRFNSKNKINSDELFKNVATIC